MVEDKNFLDKEQIDYINNFILGSRFPWYLKNYSVKDDNNKFFVHTVIPRPEERDETPTYNSPYYKEILGLLKSFVTKHNIEVKEVLRCCVNLTINTLKNQCDIHDDHDYPHKQFLMYLNDCVDKEANTIIYGKEKKYIISPEKFKAICFDSCPHYMIYPKKDIRVVLVITFR